MTHAFISLSQRIAQSAALNVQVIVTCSFAGIVLSNMSVTTIFGKSFHCRYIYTSGVTRICCEEGQSWKLGSWGTHSGLQSRVQLLQPLND